MAKQPKVYTVRNASGQFIGTYRATSAQAAIQAFEREQNTYQATFRRSAPRLSTVGFTASVEG